MLIFVCLTVWLDCMINILFLDRRKRGGTSSVERTNRKNLFKYLGIEVFFLLVLKLLFLCSCLSVCISICMYVGMSDWMFIYMSDCLSVCNYICMYVGISDCLLVCLNYVCMSTICMSVYLFVCRYVCLMSVCVYISITVSMSV